MIKGWEGRREVTRALEEKFGLGKIISAHLVLVVSAATWPLVRECTLCQGWGFGLCDPPHGLVEVTKPHCASVSYSAKWPEEPPPRQLPSTKQNNIKKSCDEEHVVTAQGCAVLAAL